MGTQCRCGTKVEFPFNNLGCIACGAGCCPACSYQLESTNYCATCALTLLEIPVTGLAGAAVGGPAPA